MFKSNSDIILFHGSATPKLAERIANDLSIDISKATINRFSDGEVNIEINENVRGKNAFIIQSTCPPVNDNLIELLLIVDALRRASVSKITTVIPYFGYARQDRRIRSARVPIAAKLVADMLIISGVNRVITVDIHAEQIQGFFNVPVDNVYGSSILLEYIKSQYINDKNNQISNNCVVVSPDIGGIMRARAIAKQLNCPLAIIDKRREQPNKTKVMSVIGDIAGKHCLLIDDIIDTGGTICNAAEVLKKRYASSISVYCVHPVLSGSAINNIINSDITELVVTDSIPLKQESLNCKKIKQVSLSKMLSETIKRVNSGESISAMFYNYQKF